uniref:Uncharacterized protein n=1 Tax=Parascaris univalens TaxID=6257 RepID=A0A915BC43_PARUN
GFLFDSQVSVMRIFLQVSFRSQSGMIQTDRLTTELRNYNVESQSGVLIDACATWKSSEIFCTCLSNLQHKNQCEIRKAVKKDLKNKL